MRLTKFPCNFYSILRVLVPLGRFFVNMFALWCTLISLMYNNKNADITFFKFLQLKYCGCLVMSQLV